MSHQKVALITGSTSGIGLGIAKELIKNGMHIVLNGIEIEETVSSIIQDMEKIGKVIYVKADLSTEEGCLTLIEKSINHFGRIDVLVNNAGIQHVSDIVDFPLHKWNLLLNINLTSAFILIQKALPYMRQHGWGRIINIASAHGLVASPQKSAYVAAKHGLVGLTKVVALETAKESITCNAICPGWVYTPLVEKQVIDRSSKKGLSLDEAKQDLLSEKQPSLQFVTPEQLGNLAVFLCSDAACQMTGSILSMDGGWTAQ